MGDITAANAVILISVPLLLPTPTQIQGFSADDVFDVEDVDSAQVLMGVDGTLSAGMVFEPTPQTFTLQADSPSASFFEAWDTGQQAAAAVFPAQANVTLTGVGRSYQCVTGFLTRVNRIPSTKKLVQPRKWRIVWQQILPIPVGVAG